MLRRIMIILWPAFLAAVAATGLFFSLFDPLELLRVTSEGDLPVTACYTIGFLFFWLFCSLASLLTYYLMHEPHDRSSPF